MSVPSIVDCLRQLHRTAAYSDMTIEVLPADPTHDREVFSVHRCIVATRSDIPVTDGLYTLKDTQPALFRVLLQFMYTDEAALSEDTVKPLLHLSRKLCVKGLESECFNFLVNRLTLQTVYMVFEEARISGRSDVERICRDKIVENPDTVQSPSFLLLSPDSLHSLLSEDLAVEESVIFNTVLAWSSAECLRRGLKITGENQREVLGKSLHSVRYIWLTDEFIRRTVITSGLLDMRQISELLEVKSTGIFPSPEFLVPKRNPNVNNDEDIKILFRFIEIRNFEDSGFLEFDGDSNDAIGITASKPVMLVGITLYGPRQTTSGLYQVILELHDGARCVTRLKTQVLMKKSIITNPIKFNEEVKLRARHKYDIVLRLKGPGTYYGALQNVELFTKKQVDGCTEFNQPDIPQFEQDGIVFKFSNSPLGSVGRTDMHTGQMPEILYKLPDDEDKLTQSTLACQPSATTVCRCDADEHI